jgi:structural maintenance of chromosome 1
MDAISFVLGVKSSQLRSNQLKDLIYQDESSQPGGDAVSFASVSAVFELDSGQELVFMRRYTTI